MNTKTTCRKEIFTLAIVATRKTKHSCSEGKSAVKGESPLWNALLVLLAISVQTVPADHPAPLKRVTF